MKRYLTPREFYKFAAVTTFITIGIVGVIVFYPTAKLPAYVAILSIVLGALCGITMGWIASIGEQVRETDKMDILNFLIRVLFFALPYMGVFYLTTKFNETYDVSLLAGSGMLVGAGLYLLIWYMKHGWKSN
jgi:hypothetical protein